MDSSSSDSEVEGWTAPRPNNSGCAQSDSYCKHFYVLFENYFIFKYNLFKTALNKEKTNNFLLTWRFFVIFLLKI